MTLLNPDGSLVSKEVYKYDFDSVGNWVKMITSVAVVEGGKINFEPTETTYRTISYYLDASVAKMLEPVNSSCAPAKSDSGSQLLKSPAQSKSSQLRPSAAAIPGAPAYVD